jgi:hypothetical protein
MAEWTIRAVRGTELERHVITAERRHLAVLQANLFIEQQDEQPWRHGKIVLLDETGAIVYELRNYNEIHNSEEDEDEDYR